MAGAVKNVAIRLQPEGGAAVVAEFKKTEDAGVAAAKATQTATESAIASADRQIAKLREVGAAAAAQANATPLQAQIDRMVGVTGGGNARADVAARTLYAADDGMARRAAQLRAEIDPLGAAQDRLNAELREYDGLARRGAITTGELAKAQDLARRKFDETTGAMNRQGGLTRGERAGRLNLVRQGADVFTTAAMGMNPGMIAIQQGPQILDALSTSGIKAGAGLAVAAGATALLAGAVVALGAAWKNGEDQSLALDRAVTGLGRTSGLTATELETLAVAAAEQGEVSIRSARDQAAAYVSTGRIGGEIIGGLIAIGKDYAAVMGMDAEEATTSLAEAMAKPDVAARELTRQIGLLDQKTLDHIDSLVKHGDQLGAQKILLDALSEAVAGQADKIGSIESAWDAAARAVSNYWDKLGRALYTTPDERLANLDKALVGARQREASGITLRPGFIAGLEEQRAALLRDQLDDQRRAARAPAAAANQAAQDRVDRTPTPRRPRADRSAEREARERLVRERREEDRAAQIEMEVSRAVGDLDHVRVLEDEAALRARIRQLVDADVDADAARTKALQEQNQLLEAREVATDREFAALQRTQGIEVARLLGNEREAENLERREEQTRRIRAYQDAGLDADKSASIVKQDLLELDQARAVVLARIVEDADREHKLTIARLAGRESESRLLDRESRVAARAREIEGRRKGSNRGDGDAQAALEIGEEIAAEAEGVRRSWVKEFVADIRRGGIAEALASQFDRAADRLINKLIDSLFDMDWGSIGGGKAGSSGGGMGNLFAQLATAVFGGPPGRNAAGTDYWSGGWSWVGEDGPELVRVPRGAQIKSNPRSMGMLGGSPAPQTIQVNLTSKLEVPAGYVPDRQLAGLLQATHRASVSEAVKIVHAAAPGQQLDWQVHKG